MDKEIILKLVEEAMKMADSNFCCNHCDFTVGASLVTENGKVYKAFNVQNDGILSICAERAAFIKALTEGHKKFKCIVITGKTVGGKFIKTVPCGYCRQFMNEYATPDFKIYTYDENEKKIYSYTLEELLPERFEYK